MNPDEADRAIARHHRMVVNSIEAGAYDENGALTAILEAEYRRDPSRSNVLTTIQERIDALEELHDNTNG